VGFLPFHPSIKEIFIRKKGFCGEIHRVYVQLKIFSYCCRTFIKKTFMKALKLRKTTIFVFKKLNAVKNLNPSDETIYTATISNGLTTIV
jgi:hypothetical protein